MKLRAHTFGTRWIAPGAMLLATFALIGCSSGNKPPRHGHQRGGQQGHGKGPGGGRKPPPAAFAACEGQSQGVACTMSDPEGKRPDLAGSCEPAENRLACKPSQPPPH